MELAVGGRRKKNKDLMEVPGAKDTTLVVFSDSDAPFV